MAVKFEGERDCYIFSNESYLSPGWRNPSWRLGIGIYRVRVTLFYEAGCLEEYFELCNLGNSRDDLELRPFFPLHDDNVPLEEEDVTA